MVSFRGQNKVGPRPGWSPLGGVIQNSRRVSPPLSYGSPPRGGFLVDFRDLGFSLFDGWDPGF